MLCPECRGDNPTEFRFCGQCGAALPVCCPACGAEVPAGFRFCGQCGGALEAQAASGGIPASAPAAVVPGIAPEAEREQRRRVAIVFADLVGSTALADRVESE